MQESSTNPARRGRPPRSAEEVDANRARIVAAARDLFAVEGYDGVSMRKVAARAQCLPSTLYTLFPNKRQLLHHLWEGIFADLVAAMEQSHVANAPAGRLTALCLTNIDFWLERPEDYRAIFLVEDRVQDSDAPYFVENALALRLVAILRDAVVEAQQRGEIGPGDPDSIRDTLLCGIQGVAYNLIAIPEFRWGDAERLKRTTVEALVRGLR